MESIPRFCKSYRHSKNILEVCELKSPYLEMVPKLSTKLNLMFDFYFILLLLLIFFRNLYIIILVQGSCSTNQSFCHVKFFCIFLLCKPSFKKILVFFRKWLFSGWDDRVKTSARALVSTHCDIQSERLWQEKNRLNIYPKPVMSHYIPCLIAE